MRSQRARRRDPRPAPDTTLILENGITVTFSTSSASGTFNVGDFWTFAARTADGSVEELTGATPRHSPPLHQAVHRHLHFSCQLPRLPDAVACRPGRLRVLLHLHRRRRGRQLRQVYLDPAGDQLPARSGGEVCILPGRYLRVRRHQGRRRRHPRLRLRRRASRHRRWVAGERCAFACRRSGMNAVITVVGSSHIELRSFAVEAASEVGVLLDQAPARAPSKRYLDRRHRHHPEDLVITASTRPAILAVAVTLLKIADNRLAMENVAQPLGDGLSAATRSTSSTIGSASRMRPTGALGFPPASATISPPAYRQPLAGRRPWSPLGRPWRHPHRRRLAGCLRHRQRDRRRKAQRHHARQPHSSGPQGPSPAR